MSLVVLRGLLDEKRGSRRTTETGNGAQEQTLGAQVPPSHDSGILSQKMAATEGIIYREGQKSASYNGLRRLSLKTINRKENLHLQ